MNPARQNIKVQWLVAVVAVALFAIKIAAWYFTNSVAILTDALESSVNVLTGFVGLYSLYLSAKPRDENHPYGHGKVEFVSAALEGVFISVAGFIIIYEAVLNLSQPHEITQLDFGIILISISAAVNFGVGFAAVKIGKRNKSMALIASGRHLQSDTYTTLGIIVGLALIAVTHLPWLDSAVAIIFAGIILYSGFKILRSSLAGIMDEADEELLQELVDYLNEVRQANWVDLHNLRIIKYGSILHMDCHLTVPWFLNVNEAHDEVKTLEHKIKEKFGSRIELFVHTDGCLDISCPICDKQDCKVRQAEFRQKIKWMVENIRSNQKHQLRN